MNRNYKDTMFRMIFNDKEDLLSLYNAVQGTNYKDEDMIDINTLENAVYINMKNDISFILDFYVNLYEHQSTINPNVPLRDLMYISRMYESNVMEQLIYSSTIVKIPTPRFVVFYNGTKKQPEESILRLSDMFEVQEEEKNLELVVRVLNVNAGNNKEMLKSCRKLGEYAIYVEKVRQNLEDGMKLNEAVEEAVETCIEHNVLRDFLLKNKLEAIQVSIFEYNQKLHMELVAEEAKEEGREEGREDTLETLISYDIKMGLEKEEIILKLKDVFGIEEDKAIKLYSKYV